MKRLAPGVVIVLCVGAASAWAQEPAAGEDAFPRASAGIDVSWWIADMEFESRTSAARLRVEESSLLGLELWGGLALSGEWAVRAAVEYSEGVDMSVLGGSLGAAYRPGFVDDPWDLSLGAGLVAARLEMEDVPGSFDPGFGLEASARLGYRLSFVLDDLSVHAGLALRHLRFGFDEDAGVVDADDEAGGAGVRFVVGLEYRY